MPGDDAKALLNRMLLLGSGALALYLVVFLSIGLVAPSALVAVFLAEMVAAQIMLRLDLLQVSALVSIQIVAGFLVASSLTAMMGGPLPSGGMIVWYLISPMAAMVFLGPLWRLVVYAVSIALALAWIVVDVGTPLAPVPQQFREAVAALNLLTAGTVVIGTVHFFANLVRRQERTSARAEARYRTTLDNLQVAVAVKDAEGRYVMVNRWFEQIAGIPASRAVGSTDARMFEPEVAQELAEKERNAVLEGRPVETDEVLAIAGARRDLVSVRFPLHDDPSRPPGICWIATDVTVRKRLQDEAMRAQKLDSLGTLAGGIAHDFNNILMACLGNVSLARELLPPDSPAGDRLGEAEQAIQRASGLTVQLLALTRSGAPLRKPVRIGSSVQDAALVALQGTGTACRFDVPDSLPAVHCDLDQIGQVVQNLALNAAQAMQPGGAVTIRCDVADAPRGIAGLRQGRAYVRIRVEDTGTGINGLILPRIFDPYFTTRPSGRGLGLAASHAIVRGHDGAIRVETEVGRGSAFTIWLPVWEGPIPGTRDLPRTPSERGRVLVMDDEPAVLGVLARMLKARGWAPVETADGAAAVERHAAGIDEGTRFAAIVLDLTVKGGMGGAEAARLILKREPRARIIAATGYVSDPVLSDPRRYGFRGVLMKPFDADELDAALVTLSAPSPRLTPDRGAAQGDAGAAAETVADS
ncbi:MAG: PAS domain-containing protein [Deltaproteobacteria bacterium]|nr:PAS domain-containing protein [Deltaproteobacteria bacterium]